MAFEIDDPETEALAETLCRVLGFGSPLEAIRHALRMAASREAMDWRVRNADLIERVRRLGDADPAFDMKRFRDDAWGDEV